LTRNESVPYSSDVTTSATKETTQFSNPNSLFARKLLAHAKRKQIEFETPADVLRALLCENTLDEIASIFKVTRQAVAYHAKKLGIETSKPGRPITMLGRVRKLGLEEIEDYFRQNPTKTFEAMAQELGVSTSTVQRHYDQFLQSVRESA